MKEALDLSASASLPKGVIKGDLEFKAAAIVRAGSRHLKRVAIKRNLAM